MLLDWGLCNSDVDHARDGLLHAIDRRLAGFAAQARIESPCCVATPAQRVLEARLSAGMTVERLS